LFPDFTLGFVINFAEQNFRQNLFYFGHLTVGCGWLASLTHGYSSFAPTGLNDVFTELN